MHQITSRNTPKKYIIWREGLWNKLQNTETHKTVTKPFSTNAGLKQGDGLGTIFFNLYINDLPALLISTNGEVLQGEMLKF